MRKLLATAALLLGITQAYAVDTSYTFTDSSSVAHTVATFGCNSTQACPLMSLADSTGASVWGTAGTANADVLTVQGIASMTPLLTNPGTAANWGVGATGAAVPANAVYLGIISGGNLTGWTGAVTANAGTNLNTSLLALESGGNLATLAGAVSASVVQSNTKQVNGVTTSTGTGAVGTGSQRVAVGTDTATIAGSAPGTAGSASSNVVTVQGIASMTPVQVAGAASVDPCTALAKTSVAISLTGTTKLVAKTSAKKTYICSLFIVSSDAENWSIVEGTKVSTECDTSTAAIIGSTTAAAGPHFAANGGLTLGSGGYTIAAGANNNFDVCLFQSGSGTTAGVLTYVQN